MSAQHSFEVFFSLQKNFICAVLDYLQRAVSESVAAEALVV